MQEENKMLCCLSFPWIILSERTIENIAAAMRGATDSKCIARSVESSDLTAMLLQIGCFCFK